jgi:hypothetical protein
MRGAKIPERANKLFDTMRIIRQFEETGQLVNTYTNGLRVVFPDMREMIVHFDQEEVKENSFNLQDSMYSDAIIDHFEDANISEVLAQGEEEKKEIEENYEAIKGIENYETVKYVKNQTYVNCSICLEDFIEGNDIIRLECFHIFHNLCILDWTKSSKLCPECRREI